MKKKSFLIATLLVVMATVVAVVSCKKERHDQNSNSNEQTVQNADNMDDYLMAFKKKLLSAEKGGETITLEQAERDLGNLLNFDFGDANYATDEVRHDTIYVPLLLMGNGVDLAQLSNTYNTAYAGILDAYNLVDFPEKSVLSVACSIDQNTKKGDAVIVQLVLTTRGLLNSYLKIGFDETDNWRVWEGLGKCDGTCVGDDHVSMIEKVYNNNRPLLECNKGRIYYTDIKNSVCFHGDAFPENNPDIHYNHHFRLWCGYGSEVNTHCVEYPEMQYYFNNFCQIIANEAWRPQGHVIMSVDSCFLDYYVSVNPQYYYTFCCLYSTGKPNCSNEPPAY